MEFLLSPFLDLINTLLVLLSGYTLGRRLSFGRPLPAPMALAIGLSAGSVFVALLADFSLLRVPFLAAGGIVSAFFTRREWAALPAKTLLLVNRFRLFLKAAGEPAVFRTLLRLVLLLWALAAVNFVIPVSGNVTNDAICYYLSAAKDWFLHGGLHDAYWTGSLIRGYPLSLPLVQTLCCFFSGFTGFFGARMFTAALTLAAAWLLYDTALNRLGRKTALLALLIFLSTPSLFAISFSPLQDTAYGLFFLALIRSLLDGFGVKREDGRQKLFFVLLFWFLAGFVLSLKYYFLTLVPGLAVIGILQVKQGAFRPAALAKIVLLLLVTLGPWYLKNRALYGSFLPSTTDILSAESGRRGALLRDEERALPLEKTDAAMRWSDFLSLKDLGNGKRTGIQDLLLLPVRLTFFPGPYKAAAGLGALYLALFPFVLLLWRDRLLFFALLLTGPFFLTWFLGFQIARYLYPLFPVIALLCAEGLHRWEKDQARLQPGKTSLLLQAALVAAFLLNIIGMGSVSAPWIKNAFDVQKSAEAETPSFAAMAYIRQLDPPASCVVSTFQDPFSWNPYFYLRQPCYFADESTGLSEIPAGACLVSKTPLLDMNETLLSTVRGRHFIDKGDGKAEEKRYELWIYRKTAAGIKSR